MYPYSGFQLVTSFFTVSLPCATKHYDSEEGYRRRTSWRAELLWLLHLSCTSRECGEFGHWNANHES